MCLMAALAAQSADNTVRIGIAWQQTASNFARAIQAVKAAGAEPVILPQIKPAGFEYDGTEIQPRYLDENGILLQTYADIVKRDTYHGTDLDQVMRDIQGVVFLGGGDISPTLFANPEPWHGIEQERNYQTTRDLSEYLTMAYCLDHNIPILGLCRGMQMLAVVSGAPLIQDLGAYYQSLNKRYRHVHRSVRDANGHRHYTPHDVTVTDTASILYGICHTTCIQHVPSWHHQAAGDLSGTPLRVTAVTSDDGVDVIEAIERTDQHFALGVQYHPEADDPSIQEIAQWATDCGWFAHATRHWQATAPADYVAVAHSVMAGNRVMPSYILEHDCVEDLAYIETDGVRYSPYQKDKYVSGVTVCYQATVHEHGGRRFGFRKPSHWIFYSFPTAKSDPFGYLCGEDCPHHNSDSEQDIVR